MSLLWKLELLVLVLGCGAGWEGGGANLLTILMTVDKNFRMNAFLLEIFFLLSCASARLSNSSFAIYFIATLLYSLISSLILSRMSWASSNVSSILLSMWSDTCSPQSLISCMISDSCRLNGTSSLGRVVGGTVGGGEEAPPLSISFSLAMLPCCGCA